VLFDICLSKSTSYLRSTGEVDDTVLSVFTADKFSTPCVPSTELSVVCLSVFPGGKLRQQVDTTSLIVGLTELLRVCNLPNIRINHSICMIYGLITVATKFAGIKHTANKVAQRSSTKKVCYKLIYVG